MDDYFSRDVDIGDCIIYKRGWEMHLGSVVGITKSGNPRVVEYSTWGGWSDAPRAVTTPYVLAAPPPIPPPKLT